MSAEDEDGEVQNGSSSKPHDITTKTRTEFSEWGEATEQTVADFKLTSTKATTLGARALDASNTPGERNSKASTLQVKSKLVGKKRSSTHVDSRQYSQSGKAANHGHTQLSSTHQTSHLSSSAHSMTNNSRGKLARAKQPGNTYMDSDFWYHKGVVLNQKDQNESALSCYKQALKLNQSHLPSIFNLACNYEKLKFYDKAKSWFKHAIEVKNDWPDAYYGLSLTCLRLNQPPEAVDAIESSIRNSKGEITQHILYARALCHRENKDTAMAL